MQGVSGGNNHPQTGWGRSVELSSRGAAAGTPEIHAAIASADVDAVARLCREGVNLKATDQDGRNALDLAQHLCGQASDNAPLAARRAQVLSTLVWHGAVSAQEAKHASTAQSIAGVMLKLGALVGAGFLGAGISAFRGKVAVAGGQVAEKPYSIRPAEDAFPLGDPTPEDLAAAGTLPGVVESIVKFDDCRMGRTGALGAGGNCAREYKQLHSAIALRSLNDTVRSQRDVIDAFVNTSAAHNAHQRKTAVAYTAIGGATLGVTLATALLKWGVGRWRGSSDARRATVAPPTVTVAPDDIEASRAAQAAHDELQARLANPRALQSDAPQA